MARGRIGAFLILALAACSDGNDRSDTRAQPIASTQSIPASMQGVSAKQLFSSAPRSPSAQPTQPLGRHSSGCLAGGVQLEESGPTWQAMRLSRNRHWGHPDVIDFTKKLSRFAATQPGWEGIYVGDISPPRGGPHSGHASHQIGLDVDFWMLPPKRLNLTRAERETLSSISLRRANGAYTNEAYTRQHHEILKAAAQDPRTTRIFVFPGAKVRMCNEETGNKAWLRKIRPWYGHHYHFHVRLRCPRGARDCVEQEAPPPGDGCAEAEEWVRNILNPPPPDPDAPPPPKPRGELRMTDLPGQCVAVLQSP
ncbi:MAG: penicillin-insensitive murein endopeptidase [Pseudomonadota bacterium]